MSRIKTTLMAALVAAGFAGCVQDSTAGYRSAITGEACEPDPATLRPHGRSGEHGNGGQNSPTGIPGDNMDDEHSGKVDCYYDGNSGQGDDKKHPCCDDTMCCNGDPDDGDGGETPPVDDGGGDDGGGETPPDGGETPPDDGGETPPDPELPPVD
jgi:hypothetical protein